MDVMPSIRNRRKPATAHSTNGYVHARVTASAMTPCPSPIAYPVTVSMMWLPISQTVANPSQRWARASRSIPIASSSHGLRPISTSPSSARYVPSSADSCPRPVSAPPRERSSSSPPWRTHIRKMKTPFATRSATTSHGRTPHVRGSGTGRVRAVGVELMTGACPAAMRTR